MGYRQKITFESPSQMLSYQRRSNPAKNSEFNFQVDNSTSNVTYQYTCLAMNIAIADDIDDKCASSPCIM